AHGATTRSREHRMPPPPPAGRLTVKLRGRTTTPDGPEGAQFPSPRGAKPQAHHGPLERLLAAGWPPTRVLLRSVSRNGNCQPNDSLRSFTELGNGSGYSLWRAPTVSGYSTRLSCDCWSAEQ